MINLTQFALLGLGVIVGYFVSSIVQICIDYHEEHQIKKRYQKQKEEFVKAQTDLMKAKSNKINEN